MIVWENEQKNIYQRLANVRQMVRRRMRKKADENKKDGY